MLVQERIESGAVILAVQGSRFVIGQNLLFRSLYESVKRALDSGYKAFVLDFSKVTYMDSTGIGKVVSLFKTISNAAGQLVITGTSEDIRKKFEESRLDRILRLRETPDPRPSALNIDQRRANRYELRMKAQVQTDGENSPTQPIEAWTRDVSAKGLFLELDKPIVRGTQLRLTLQLPAEVTGKPVVLRCVSNVVRVTQSKDRTGVGAVIESYEFIRPTGVAPAA